MNIFLKSQIKVLRSKLTHCFLFPDFFQYDILSLMTHPPLPPPKNDKCHNSFLTFPWPDNLNFQLIPLGLTLGDAVFLCLYVCIIIYCHTFHYIYEGVVYVFMFIFMNVIPSPSVSQAFEVWLGSVRYHWSLLGLGIHVLDRNHNKTKTLKP